MKSPELESRHLVNGTNGRGVSAHYHRLVQLQQLIAEGPFYNPVALAAKFAISRRTLYRDLRILKDAGVNISFDKEYRAFDIINHRFRDASQLSDHLVEAIFTLAMVASTSQIRKIPHIAVKLASAVSTLTSSWRASESRELARLIRACNVVRMKQTEYDVNEQILKDVVAAIRRHKKIRLSVRTGIDTVQQTKLSPYGLEVAADRFLLVGRSTYHRRVCRFDLSQIVHTEVLDEQIERVPQVRRTSTQIRRAAW